MGNEKSTKYIFATYAIFIFLLIAAFVIGTAVGFNVALQKLSGCETISCDELGVNADVCELCGDEGMHLVRLGG